MRHGNKIRKLDDKGKSKSGGARKPQDNKRPWVGGFPIGIIIGGVRNG